MLDGDHLDRSIVIAGSGDNEDAVDEAPMMGLRTP